MASEMKLFVLGGDKHSASIDPESLQILTYLRLLKSNQRPTINIIHSCNPWQSPSGFFPTLLLDGKTYVGSERIIRELKKLGFELDKDFSEDQNIDAMAFGALVKDQLKLALLYIHWMDGKNYTEVTRQWYGMMSFFPVSQFLLSRQHRLVEREIKTSLPEESSLDHRGLTLISIAEECLNLLSVRLKDKPFFSQEKPSTLDVMVFGYLDIIGQYPLPGNNRLQLHLNSLKNLTQFCDRVRSIAFPEITARRPIVTDSLFSGPLWKDPTVWACLFVGGALVVVQGVRIGLFSRIAERLNGNIVADHIPSNSFDID